MLEPNTEIIVVHLNEGDGIESAEQENETFDSGHVQTDTDGSGEIPFSIPVDARNDVLINDHTPYRNSSESRGSVQSSINADITVSPDTPSPGGAVEISYETDATDSVSAIATFPTRNGASSAIIGTSRTLLRELC